ncbi:MAG: aspartate/glutamate racemase family protein [Bacillota bacterium]
MQRILVIIPIVTALFDEEVAREFSAVARPGTEVEVTHLTRGPASIESSYDEALATPEILERVKSAEEQGFSGVVIDCFGDPGVRAARELVRIPVVGAGSPSMLLAAGMGHRFSVVSVLQNVVPILEDIAKLSGVEDKLASVRSVNIPVLDLGDRQGLEGALLREMAIAVEEDGAHVLVLGCTGMMGVAGSLQRALEARFGHFVPVVDPVGASMAHLQGMLAMNTSHSKLTYMDPPQKKRA